MTYASSVGFTSVAAAILAAVEGGILPPGPDVRNGSDFSNHTPIPPGRMPGSTAGKMPAATLNTYCMARRPRPELPRAPRQNALGVPGEDFHLILVRDFRAEHLADLLRQAVAVRIGAPDDLVRADGGHGAFHQSSRRTAPDGIQEDVGVFASYQVI